MFRPDALTLSAYADGELDAETAADVEAAAARDAAVRQQLDEILRINAMVRVAYDQPRHEPVPADLVAAIMTHPAPPAAAEDPAAPADKVISLAARRRRLPTPSAAWATAAAAAIALVIGVGGAQLFDAGDTVTSPPGIPAEAQAVLRQRVNEALETLPNGQQAPIAVNSEFFGTVTPLRTYVNGEGLYCRDYIVALGLNTGTSTACRMDEGNWRAPNQTGESFGRI